VLGVGFSLIVTRTAILRLHSHKQTNARRWPSVVTLTPDQKSSAAIRSPITSGSRGNGWLLAKIYPYRYTQLECCFANSPMSVKHPANYVPEMTQSKTR